jgi:hypothetical protein
MFASSYGLVGQPCAKHQHSANSKMTDTQVTEWQQEKIDYLNNADLYNIDRWYYQCKDFTFKTNILSLTRDDAIVILQTYAKKILQLPYTIEQSEYERIYSTLHEKIELCIKDVAGESSQGVFVRLSARSPKDSGFQTTRMKKLLKELLEHQSTFSKNSNEFKREQHKRDGDEDEQYSDEDDDDEHGDVMDLQNYEFLSFFTAQIQSLRIQNADEALELLTSSERVYEDLKSALDYADLRNEWGVHICVRKWYNFPVSNEFRGFVHGRKLVALSQYFDMIYFAHIELEQDKIAEKIRSYFDTIKNKIPYENCVIDFAIIPQMNEFDTTASLVSGKIANDLDSASIMVIEFNPYDRFTSPCQFHWQADKDLLHGKDKEKDFEFRYTETSLPVLRNQGSGLEIDLGAMLAMSGTSEELLNEHKDLLTMVQTFVGDDYERINSDLRYVLRATNSQRFYELYKQE